MSVIAHPQFSDKKIFVGDKVRGPQGRLGSAESVTFSDKFLIWKQIFMAISNGWGGGGGN